MKKHKKVAITVNVNECLSSGKGPYEKKFLTTKGMHKRGDKNVYLRAEYHERLLRIVQMMGGDKMSLYAYVDNILTHHFEFFEDMLTAEFNSKSKPLF